jgi:hypothetical protein
LASENSDENAVDWMREGRGEIENGAPLRPVTGTPTSGGHPGLLEKGALVEQRQVPATIGENSPKREILPVPEYPMSETVQPEHPWKTKGYLRIHDVMVSPPMLLVSFEDGSVASVETRRLLPPDTEGVDWSRLIFCPYEIGVPSATEIVVIPSSRIRALTTVSMPSSSCRVDGTSEEPRSALRALREQRDERQDVAAAAESPQLVTDRARPPWGTSPDCGRILKC